MNRVALALVVAFTIFGCAGPIVLDVDLPIDQTSPFDDLVAQNGDIFFQFDLLVETPGSINDTDPAGTSVIFPDPPATGQARGFNADDKSFDISDVLLDPQRFYRVTMFGLIGGALPPAYRAIGDCPLKKALGDNNTITLCFGLNNTTPLCTDRTAFADCPK